MKIQIDPSSKSAPVYEIVRLTYDDMYALFLVCGSINGHDTIRDTTDELYSRIQAKCGFTYSKERVRRTMEVGL